MSPVLARRRRPLSGFLALHDLASAKAYKHRLPLPVQLSPHLRRDIGLPDLDPAPRLQVIRWR